MTALSLRAGRTRSYGTLESARVAAPAERPEPTASPLLALVGADAGGDPVAWVGAVVAKLLDAIPGGRNPHRDHHGLAGHRIRQAPRNLRLWLTAELTGSGPTALGAAEIPPISRQVADQAIHAGRKLAGAIVTAPGSRFNPNRPPARVERRRGASPEW